MFLFQQTHTLLCKDIKFTQDAGVCFGSKLVRGAYMDKERRLAKEQGYTDPVCDTFDDTSDMYHRSMDTVLRHISRGEGRMNTVIASHNEDTVKLAVARCVRIRRICQKITLAAQAPCHWIQYLYQLIHLWRETRLLWNSLWAWNY